MVRRSGRALVVGGTALIAGTYGLARYGYGLFLPTFQSDFALTATVSGLLATGAFGSYCAAALLSGRLVAAGRPRGAATLAGTLAAGGCLAVAVAQTPLALGLSLLVAGSGAGLASPALVALVDRAVPEPSRPRAQTVVNAGTGLGVLVSGPFALAGHWRLAWFCFAVLTAAATVATLRAAPTSAATSAGPTGPLGSTVRQLRPAALAALLAGVGSAAVWTFGRSLVVDAGGLGSLGSSMFWVVLGAAGITGAVAGDAVERWDVPRAWAVFALALAGSTLGLAAAPGVPVVAFASAAAFGGGYVALSGVLIAWGSRLVPDAPGSANAVLFLTLAAGQALGALLLGGVADLTSPAAAFVVAAALVAASSLAATRRPAGPGTHCVQKNVQIPPRSHVDPIERSFERDRPPNEIGPEGQ